MKRKVVNLERSQKGFTLIELLIVIAIIAILAVIVIMNLAGSRDKARAARAKSDMETIYKAIVTSITSGQAATGTSSIIGSSGGTSVATAINLDVAVCNRIIDTETSPPQKLISTCPKNAFDDTEYYKIYISGSTVGVLGKFPSSDSPLCQYRDGSFVVDNDCKIK